MNKFNGRKRLLVLMTAVLLLLSGCAAGTTEENVRLEGFTYEGSMELEYAEGFSLDYYAGGYQYIRTEDERQYLAVPEGAEVPEGLPEDITILQKPLNHIYLVSSAVMQMFSKLGQLSRVRFDGLEADRWYLEEIRQAMEEGSILYAGKYSAPDYELLRSEQCDLAVENRMITHTPEVQEQLEQLGIPVLIDCSSSENTPQGRMEWIRLYGALTDQEELARQIYQEQADALDRFQDAEGTGKTVAFFSITNTGGVTVRKSSDYIAQMIRLAGGEYLPSDLTGDPDSKSFTETIQMEEFYEKARDADILIYNSVIYGELQSVSDLTEKSEMMKNFKAVQEGQVYCTDQDLYQASMEMGDFTEDLYRILHGESEDLKFMKKLE